MCFRLKVLFLFTVLCAGTVTAALAEDFGPGWQTQKGTHFIVHYAPAIDPEEARAVLSAAERYYTSVAERIGYARYHNFWTWEDRAQIVLYADQAAFSRATGQPAWSLGSAVHHHEKLHSRAIFSYEGAPNFIDGILPHEIGHLILNDFVGDISRVPIWFNEGVAQLQEANKRPVAEKMIRLLKKTHGLIPVAYLENMDVRRIQQPLLVDVFYAQSFSIVDYMLRTYGSFRFSELCRQLSEGKSFEEALRVSYRTIYDSLGALEKKWLNSIPNG